MQQQFGSSESASPSPSEVSGTTWEERTVIGSLLSRQQMALFSAIIFLQLAWLTMILLTGASLDTPKMLALIVYSLVIGGAVFLFPREWQERLGSYYQQLSPRQRLGIILAAVLLLGLSYAFHQRAWTWDEEQNLIASQFIATEGVGRFFEQYASFEWLGRQHPPLVPLINGFAIWLSTSHIVVLRILSLLFTLGTLSLTYLLGREFYDKSVGVTAAFFLGAHPLIMRLGTAGLTDMQVTFFFVLSLFLTVRLVRQPSRVLAVALGITVGLGLLSKYTMVFIGPTLLVCYLASKRFRRRTWHFAAAGFIALGMLALWLLYAWQSGILDAQSGLAQVRPGWFVTHSGARGWLANSLVTKLPSAIGPYNIPVAALGLWLALRRRTFSDWFAIAWIAIVSFLLVMTVPDHRYFMPVFPALALVMARWVHTQKWSIAGKIGLLTTFYTLGALWMFIDWQRASELFVN